MTSLYFESKALKRLPDFVWSGGMEEFYIDVDHLESQAIKGTRSSKVRSLRWHIRNLETLPDFFSGLAFYSFTVESNSLKEISPSLLNNSDLHYFSISGKHISKLPDLDKHSKLSRIRVATEKPLDLREWKLPPSVIDLCLESNELKLPSLKQLPLVDRIRLKGLVGDIGDEIENCKVLRDFSCEHGKVEKVSSKIAQCQRLQTVCFDHSVKDFPLALLQLSALETLRLRNNIIPSLNLDWSELINLKDLDLRNNSTRIESFSFLSDLPKLNTLMIEGNTLASRYVWINRKKIPLTSAQGFFNDCKPDFKEVLSFSAALAKISCEENLKQEFLDHFWKTGELIGFATANTHRLTHALNIAYTPLKTLLHDYLQRFIKASHGIASLNEQSVVYVEGKTIESLSKLKEAVQSLGAKYRSDLAADVTHIVLGKNPSDENAFNKDRYLYLYESDVFDLVDKRNPKFLVADVEQGNKNMLSGVTDLLLSAEAVNVNIGLQMLHTGGVPEEILEVVLMLAKSNPDNAVRAEAKKILNLHAPASWRLLIDDKQLFKNLNEEVKEQDIFNKLKTIEKDAGFDSASILSLTLYHRYKKGLRFMLLTNKASDEQKKKMYDLLMQGEELDFATGLGFKNWKGHDPASMTLYTHKIKFPFPVDVLKWYRVTSLNFHNCKFSAIPREISSFTTLKKLDLSCNFLSKLPAHLEKLTTLEEMDLSSNNFQEFPTNLVKFKNLKKVDLRFCRVEYSIVPLTIPDDVRQALPACEILV